MFNNAHLSVLIEQQAQRYGEKTAMTYRDYADNSWHAISWQEFADRVMDVSRALVSCGVERGERIAIFSQNKPECMYAAFGAYGIRGVITPFYPTSSGAQVIYMMNDAEVRLLFVGEQPQYDTAISVATQLSSLERIIIFDRNVKRRPGDTISLYFDDFLEQGRQKATDIDPEIKTRKEEARFEDIADILYTSGTTGNSKGVIMTYTMYHAAFEGNDATLPVSEDDIVLNFLPFTHVFERGWAYLCLTEGAQLAVNLKPQDISRSLKEVRPTCMASVPRFWEKVYQGVQEKIASSSTMQRKLMQSALETGMRYWEEYGSKNKPAPLGLSMKYKFYDKTIYSLLRRTLGLDRPNFFPTAGATVSPEVEKFVHGVGIYMMVGYGLTESTATVSNDHKEEPCTLGSIGRPIPGLEVRIGENDEILLRGKTITPGYYKKETSTKAAIDADGWFHTGDAGYMKDGELYMKERIKDLYKTSNGKYIAPQIIESKLTIDRYIEQCVIIADKRKFVSALIVPKYKLLEAFARENGLDIADRAAICRHPEVMKMIKERIDTLQQDLANYEKVKYFILLPDPFSMENGELTNTLKVKRNVVCKRYAAEIDQLYDEAEKKYKPI